jgi:hypothetical protein
VIFGVGTLAFAGHLLSPTTSEAKWKGNRLLALRLAHQASSCQISHPRLQAVKGNSIRHERSMNEGQLCDELAISS